MGMMNSQAGPRALNCSFAVENAIGHRRHRDTPSLPAGMEAIGDPSPSAERCRGAVSSAFVTAMRFVWTTPNVTKFTPPIMAYLMVATRSARNTLIPNLIPVMAADRWQFLGRHRGHCPCGGSSMSCHVWCWLASRTRLLRGAGAPELAQTIADLELERIERDVPFGPPDIWLDDGDEIDCGGTVIVAPGARAHTWPYGLPDRRAGLGFTGDHILPRITPSIALERMPEKLPLRFGSVSTWSTVWWRRVPTPPTTLHGACCGRATSAPSTSLVRCTA